MGPAPRILVLTGDAVEAAACELALETGLPGCSVTTERTAEGGLSAARGGGFDVVVTGAELPDGHELDVIRSLSAEPAAPPIVAVLGRGSERLAAAALAAGADDVLVAGRDFTVDLADSVAIAYGRALRDRRRAGLVALGERLDGETERSGVLDAAVAGLALTLDADAASAWARSSAGNAEAHLAAPLAASADAMAAHFDDAPGAGETLVLAPDEVGEPALAWAASSAGDAIVLAVRRSDTGWPPDDLRWLELAAHATLGALVRTLERERTRDEPDGDAVTGLPGERRFLSALEAESERARRHTAPVAMLLVEVDELDAVAERYGHEVVAAILREAGEAVAGSVRGYDLAARVGPQGFGVLLPAADRAEAEVVAERIRSAVAAIEFPSVGRLTVSLGLAAYPEAVDSVQALLEAAEQALLVGRRSGDVVVAAPARRTDEPPAGRW
jgi:diguanylate cyclase (GGDEF)-like protein